MHERMIHVLSKKIGKTSQAPYPKKNQLKNELHEELRFHLEKETEKRDLGWS